MFVPYLYTMRLACLSLLVLFFFSCSKNKGYTCDSDCENITLQVNLLRQNGTTGSLQVPYSIYFLKQTSTWFDYPGTEYEVASGETDASGLLRKIVKINKGELEGAKALYIRLYPTTSVHLCKNPALIQVASVPVNNTAQFTMEAYIKKPFTVQWSKQSAGIYNQTDLLYGSPTVCTYGFSGERQITGTNGSSTIEALLNSYLYITIKETSFGSPNTYHWTSDSVWVDGSVTSYNVVYWFWIRLYIWHIMSTPASYTHRLGEQLRTLRLAKKMSLRQVAIATGIDVAVLSKLERGERKLNERIVLQLGKLYKADVASLLVMLYSNQVLQHIGTEANALDILNVAEEEVLYQQRVKVGPKQLIQKMVRVLELDGRVKKAWLYGSVVRADFSASSDVDVMIEFNKKKKYSLFDLIDIAHRLEQVLHRRVDLHERGTLHDEAQANAENDLQLIYG